MNTPANLSTNSQPTRRRWRQFSLRTLLLAATILCMGLAWIANERQQAYQQRCAIESIEKLGGRISADRRQSYISLWFSTFVIGDSLYKRPLHVRLEAQSCQADEALLYFPRLQRVRSLDITQKRLTANGISKLKGLKEIETACFDQVSFPAEGWSCIETLTSLDDLQISNTNSNDNDLTYLRELKKLEYLSMTGLKFKAGDLKSVQGLDRLKMLDLSSTPTTDRDIRYLRHLPIESLNLSDTAITDSGIKELAKIDTLYQLTLYHTSITDDGLAHLEKLTGLKEVALQDTQVTDAGVERLRHALGKVRVWH